jgi:AP-1 complex subunit mu
LEPSYLTKAESKQHLLKNSKVFEDYFKDVEEESIRDNFVIIYELLDELVSVL